MKKICLIFMLLSYLCFAEDTQNIFNAIKEGNLDKVKMILKDIKNINAMEENSYTLLDLAIITNNSEVVKEIIKHGADVNKLNVKGFLPIEVAIHFDNLEILKTLIENGADTKALDSYEQSPLFYSISRYSNKCFDYLISIGIRESGPRDLLEFAIVENNNTYAAKRLIEIGMLDKSTLENKRALIFSSIDNKNSEMAKLLIEYGLKNNDMSFFANGDVVKEMLDTDFFELQEYIFTKFPHLLYQTVKSPYEAKFIQNETYSCKLLRKNKELFLKLLDKYPDLIEVEDYLGQSALLFAASNGDLDLANKLIQKGANCQKIDFEGNTALILAARSGNSKLTELFVQKGLNVNAKNNKGETALMLSAKSIKPKFFAQIYISSEKVSYNLINQLDRDLTVLYDNETWNFMAYISSIANSNVKLLEDNFVEKIEPEENVCNVLLKNGANLNDKNLKKWSPLTYAVVFDDYDLVKFFIEKGAEVNNTNIEGLTNLDFALVYSDIKIIELLLSNKGYFGLEKTFKCNPLSFVHRFTTNAYESFYNSEDVLKIQKLLLSNGFTPNKKSAYDFLPIYNYVESDEYLEITKLFIDNKVDINVKNYGKTPLSIAVEANAIKTVQFLVSKGADLKYKTPEGKSLLSLTENEEIIKYLKSKGIK